MSERSRSNNKLECDDDLSQGHRASAPTSGAALYHLRRAVTYVTRGISLLIHVFLPRLPSSVPLWAVLLALIVSMTVGLFFGIYPAQRAAKLDPMMALRDE